MAEAIQVFKDTFDSSENHNPRNEELLGTFMAKDTLSAHGNAGNFIAELPPFKHYLGWDGRVYPQIRIKRIDVE